MMPYRDDGLIRRPGRGDVDLETLQHAFLQSTEKPSAKVTRSKAPPIKTASDIPFKKSGGVAGANKHDKGASPRSIPIPTQQPRSKGIYDSQARMGNERESEDRGVDYEGQRGSGLARAAMGGMALAAPGIVSNVTERSVRAPAPMRVKVSGNGGNIMSGGSLSKEHGHLGLPAKNAPSGGFPAALHRSEMGRINLAKKRRSTQKPESAPTTTDPEVSAIPACGARNAANTESSRGVPHDIHQENVSRVSAMSPQEVEEALREIRETLPPEAVQMLKCRGRDRTAAEADIGCQSTTGTHKENLSTEQRVESGVLSEGQPRAPSVAGGNETSRRGTGPRPDSVLSQKAIKGHDAHHNDAGGELDSGVHEGGNRAHLDGVQQQQKDPGKSISKIDEPSGGNLDVLAGAPTRAQRAATAAGGINSQQTLAAAVASLPHAERAKLSWTSSIGDPITTEGGTNEGAVVRVDLDGKPIAPAEFGEGHVEAATELYHHGDDPGRAGYTPTELLRLTRSTVPGQRQLALRALAGVLRGRAACIGRGEAPPHPRLPEMVPVAIRSRTKAYACLARLLIDPPRLGLDDGNPSVALTALNALEAFVAPRALEEEQEEAMLQGLSWSDYQAFPAEVRPLCSPEEERLLPPPDDDDASVGEKQRESMGGSEGSEPKTMDELARLCYEDPCRGIIEMGLLPILRSKIEFYGASPSRTGQLNDVDGAGTNSMASSGSQPPSIVPCKPSPAALHSSVAKEAHAVGHGAKALYDADKHCRQGEGALNLHPRALLSCLRALCAIARRSPWTAARVADEPGLMGAVREVFLEPHADGSLPVELSTPWVPQASDRKADLAASNLISGDGSRATTVATRQETLVGEAMGDASWKGQLALMAVRLMRVLVQSSREVALHLSRGPLLESTKSLLALGRGLPRPSSALLATQCETLELWRACLTYGFDVEAADTVILLAHEQGWWPGSARPGPAMASSSPSPASLTLDGGTSPRTVSDEGTGSVGNKAKDGDSPSDRKRSPGSSGMAAGELHEGATRVRVAFYRALHQLLCVCMLPPSASGGQGGATRKAGGRENTDSGVSVGGIVVVPDTWAAIGDTLDTAVEGSLAWLLESWGSSHAKGNAVQSAAIHFVACWLERYRLMTRRADRRSSRRLAAIVEDAVVLFSSLVASAALPAAVASATAGCQPASGSGSRVGLQADSGRLVTVNHPMQNGLSERSDIPGYLCDTDSESPEAHSVVTATIGLDWLAGLFRLGLACERVASGEVSAAHVAASDDATGALARFLSSPASGRHPGDTCDGRKLRQQQQQQQLARRRIWRASARSRWLGCRLAASFPVGNRDTAEEVEGRPYPWAKLRQDCALQAVSLCKPGDEAVAVGLVMEALPDPGDTVQPGDGAPALLRKMFRGAISDPVALAQASFHLDGRWESIQDLRICAPPGASSLLPLPRHWLLLPLASQGGERAAAAAVSACLEILVRLEKEGSAFVMPSPAPGLVGGSSPQDVDGVCSDGVVVGSAWLSPELKFYHLANACMYGITVVSTATAERHFDWLLTRYLTQCGYGFERRLVDVIENLAGASTPDPSKIIADAVAMSSSTGGAGSGRGKRGQSGRSRADAARDRVQEARAQHVGTERALSEFVRDLATSFVSDSFGLKSFARVLKVFVRTGFSPAVRCILWSELGALGLLSLLDAPRRVTSSIGHSITLGVDDGSSTLIELQPCKPTDGAREHGSCEGELMEDAYPYLYPPDTDGAIIDAYLAALEHPRFGPSDDERVQARERDEEEHEVERSKLAGLYTMRSIAVHHIACYFFTASAVVPEGELLITLLEAGATQVMVDALIESMELAGFGSTRCKYWHGSIPKQLGKAGECSLRQDLLNKKLSGTGKLAEPPGVDGLDDTRHADNQLDAHGQGENLARDVFLGEGADPVVVTAEVEKVGDPPCAAWRPDFGRRKRFERVLRMGSDGRVAESVAAEVIGHECGGTEAKVDGCNHRECFDREVPKREDNHHRSGHSCRGLHASCPCVPEKACLRVSKQSERRRRLLQSYLNALRADDVETNVGSTSGLRNESEPTVKDLVDRLSAALLLS